MNSEFDKVIGYESIVNELKRVCDILKNPLKYKKLGVNPPKGILLHGDPGLGKTLMAECFIKESKLPCYKVRKMSSNKDFLNEIVTAFEKAKECESSIVFLDDLDKFSNGDEDHQNSEEFVTVQSCIDEAKTSNVFVIATANNIRFFPSSLLRDGRLEVSIKVDLPLDIDKPKIIEYYLSKKKFVSNIDCELISRLIGNRSCATLERIVNEAGIIAGYKGKESIEMDDFVEAILRKLFHSPICPNEKEKRTIAIHEAGHAVVSELLKEGSVSIVSINHSLGSVEGVTCYYDIDDYNKKWLDNKVYIALAGKAATEILLNSVDIGSRFDIEEAFGVVESLVDMHCANSFSEHLYEREMSDLARTNKDRKVAYEMEEYYQKTKKMIFDNLEFINKIVDALCEKVTLLQSDIASIRSTCKIVL